MQPELNDVVMINFNDWYTEGKILATNKLNEVFIKVEPSNYVEGMKFFRDIVDVDLGIVKVNAKELLKEDEHFYFLDMPL